MGTLTMNEPPLNIPAGNRPILPDAQLSPEEDRLTGDKWTDYKRAMQMVDVKEDLTRIPCLRTALLYGIGGGIGVGAVRFFGSGRVKTAVHWTFASFLAISVFQWESCRSARARELASMRALQARFKHVSELKEPK